ncbi:MAG: DEAD/DEAH box helicase [Chlorobium sp.]|nr:MAG: DEAD/DEAH box helicase [Chlorobium sp.]
MIALHISVLDGTLWLWSEGKTPGTLKELRQAIKAIGMISPRKSLSKDLFAWLPCRGEKHVPSSPLVGKEPDRRLKEALRPFQITALRLDTNALRELSLRSGEGNIPGSGVIFGSSIFWAQQFLENTLRLIANESFLPSVIQKDNFWEARWIAIPDSRASLSLEKLAETMPPICRAVNRSNTRPPDEPSQLLLNRLLSETLDNIVRSTEQGTPLKKAASESIHDAWLEALASSNSRIAWKNTAEIEELARQINLWRRPIEIHERSPFNFCFRLAEPPEKSRKQDIWQLTYLLQLKADPSLILDAVDLWNPESSASHHIKAYSADCTEFILTALGEASGLYPKITESLKKKNPGGFKLDTEGAYRFLLDYAEVLRAAGFVVMLPSWWVGRGGFNRIGVKTKIKTPAMKASGSGLSLDSMVECDYAVALGSEELDLQELKTLAALKAPLVKVRGQWTQIDHKELASAVRFLEKQPKGELSARDILSTALGAKRNEGGLPVSSVEVKGWIQELLEKLSGNNQFELLASPEGLHGKLRVYQERGFSWLSFLRQWGLGACLADDMGLGKTIQTLAMVLREREQGEKRPVLLICPTSVVNNWRKEAELFTPGLSVLVHHGIDRMKSANFRKAVSKSAIIISSYGLLQRDITLFNPIPWAGIILDEAQNIKNPETKQSKAARSIRADYRIALTGTPVENHVGDLWALMDFLNPGFLGSQHFFKTNFYTPIQWYGDSEAAARLKTLTGPFILRRMKTDRSIISDLPDKIEMKEYCSLTKEQASLYKAVVEDLQEKIESAEGIDRRGLVLALLLKLKQVCNHPAHFLGDNSSIEKRSGKMQRLNELLDEIHQAEEKTLIFTQFTQMGRLIQQHLQERFGEEVLYLHGGVSKKRRDEMIETFQQTSGPSPSIFILSLKAGGTGLNLTGANHVIHYDRWWNPAVENQATDRAFRIGQKKNVQVHKFITAGTLEERIDDMIDKKTTIANQVLGTSEQWLTELSNKDLRNLVMLGQNATGE